MLDEDSWQRMRGEAMEFCRNQIEGLIETWCKKAHVDEPVGYYHDRYKCLTIYTNRPGCLIGKGGCLINEFKENLKNEYGKEIEVKLVEIKGGICNKRKGVYPYREVSQRYSIEGKLHKGEHRIFVETEQDENGYPIGTWVDEVMENIPENADVTIVIDFKKMN